MPRILVLLALFLATLPAQVQAQVMPPRPSAKPSVVRADALAVTTTTDFPLFVHTLDLPTPDGAPPEMCDFDWDMGQPMRFRRGRGRTYAAQYPPGKYAVSCTVTNTLNGHTKSYVLNVVSTPSPILRRSVQVRTSSDLQTNAQKNDVTLLLANDITPLDAIRVGNRVIIDGQGHTLKGNPQKTMFTHSADRDGFTLQNVVIDGFPREALRVYGSRITLRNITINTADNFYIADRTATGVLVEDCATRDVGSLKHYGFWDMGYYYDIRGLYIHNTVFEHGLRGAPVCFTLDRCHLTNGDFHDQIPWLSKDVQDMVKGTDTKHTPHHGSIDRTWIGTGGTAKGGGDMGFGPLILQDKNKKPYVSSDPPGQLCDHIAVTRCFAYGGAGIWLRVGTIQTRLEDNSTNYTGSSRFGYEGNQTVPGVPRAQGTFKNNKIGPDLLTPLWKGTKVAA